MTPIPPDVAAAIVAAGYFLVAEPVTRIGGGRPMWRWGTLGGVEAPLWRVDIGDANGRGETPRAATLDALDRLAAADDRREKEDRAECARVRLAHRKASALAAADACAKRAADVRTLAATVAAMWPEVTP